MTEIVAASDSHGRGHVLLELEKWYPRADLYLNCGDLEENPLNYPHWVFVRGNNDYFAADSMPEERIIQAGDHKILLVHSHRFSYYNREQNMAAYALAKGCDIVIYGHTHVASINRVDGVLLVNPGSLWMSRNGKEPSFALIRLHDNGQTEAEIIYEDDWPEIEEQPKKKKRRWIF